MQTVTYDASSINQTLPSVTAPSGYTFAGWVIDGVTYTKLTDELLTAINGTIKTATPKITQNYVPGGGDSSGGSSGSGSGGSTPAYAVSASSSQNGIVTVNPKNAEKGTTVTITVKPDKGYKLDTLKVTDKNGDRVKVAEGKDGKFTFVMPAGKVTVKATFTKIEEGR